MPTAFADSTRPVPRDRGGLGPDAVLDVFVARQPIFDEQNRRVAYELLYRSSATARTSAGQAGDGGAPDADTALHAVVSIGLDRLTGPFTAFVNITREHLLEELYRVLHPQRVVLELLETVDGDEAVVAACRRATAQGYVLALDDFDGRETLEPLLEHVRIVKVDVQQHPPDALAALVRRLRARGLTVLAERVETDAVRRQCADYGCTLFQGYVFSRPETLGGRSVPAQQAAILNLLGLLDDESVGEAQLDEAMRGHPSIAHALLGLVGSAAMGAREVRSIPQAIRLVGRGSLRRWMLVLLAASAASQGPVAHEAALQALVRARFAERIAEAAGLADPGSHFLVGLLSRLDVLLGVPLPEAVARLPLGDDVRTALLTGDGALGRVLAVVEAWQGADWDAVPALVTAAGVSAVGLPELFADATAWAGDRLPVAMARRVTSRG